MEFTITLQTGDGYGSRTVKVSMNENLPAAELPEYGEPGYDAGRKAPVCDWEVAELRIKEAVERAEAEFMHQFKVARDRDLLKVQRINNAKGVLPVEAQIERDSIDQAVGA